MDGLLALSVVLLFVFGMVGIFTSYNNLWLVFFVWASVQLAAVVSFIALERRSSRRLARIVAELRAEDAEAFVEGDIEASVVESSEPIRPR